MPLYDYRCSVCSGVFEEYVFGYIAPSSICPGCGGIASKIFSPPGFKPDVFPADGVFLKNVSAAGKRFFSKDEMRKYAKDNDMEIGYLL